LSATTDFVSEVVRAANEVEKLTSVEVSRLLDLSVDTIRDLRHQAGIIPIEGRDALIYIRTVAAGASRVSTEEWHHGFRQAAEMIRDLRIVLDTGTEIFIRGQGR
jgi:hypothetical protein